MSDKKPVIGISWGGRVPVSYSSLTSIVTQIRSAGAIPKVLTNYEIPPEELEAAVAKELSQLDGLVLMGNNNDLDPALYGAEKLATTKVEDDLERKHFEESAIRQGLAMKLPILGICGGLQRINTIDHHENGGTLVQHVPDVVGHGQHTQGDGSHEGPDNIAPFLPAHPIAIDGDSLLAEIAGHTEKERLVVRENSYHHQAADKIHKDFRASAKSFDGITEAIEPAPGGRYSDQFVLGVQWHPEFGASELGGKIAVRLTEEAKTYAKTKSPLKLVQGINTEKVLGDRQRRAQGQGRQ